jgi:hypothetical protein
MRSFTRLFSRFSLLFILLLAPAWACEEGSVARCQCGCGGTPRPYCAHKDCQCAKSKIATVEAAEKLTAGCQCGCGGTPRPYCAHKGCQCASTNIETGQQAPLFTTNPAEATETAKGCSCGCGGTPRPYCAHRDCACAKTVKPAIANALAAGCGCGCGGTPRPYCAHKGCQCASTSVDTGETAQNAFQDPMVISKKAKKCKCGCGGTPRPTCAYKECVCADTKSVHKPEGRLVSLAESPQAGSVRLVGDGATTSHSTLELNNPTDETLAYQVDDFIQFSPEDPSNQALTCTEEAVCSVPPGETVHARLDTVCSDVKSKPPPGEGGAGYAVTQPPEYVEPVVTVAREMAEDGAFDELPMTRCKATSTVSQLALWKFASEGSENPEDQITKEGFQEELYRQIGKTPEELPPEQREKVEEGVDNIFEQVDFTMKNAKDRMGSVGGNACICSTPGR